MSSFSYENHPDWDWAVKVFNTLRPLIGRAKYNLTIRRQYCGELGISETTFYEYLSKLKENPVPSAVLSMKRGPKKGRYRTTELQELMMSRVIKEHYLTRQKKSGAECYRELIKECVENDVEVPSLSTLSRRIQRLPRKVKDKGRIGASRARKENSPATSHFITERPMQCIQINHTTGVIQLVDSEYRDIIGRPVITFSIDLYTRICPGFNIDLFGPNSENVAKTITHICFDKVEESKLYGCEKEYPFMGVPEEFNLDNAGEFKSNALKRGTAEHGMALINRIPDTPHLGGNIERFLGTINRKTELIPGTTFANIKERGDYDSEKHAIMTLSEYKAFIYKVVCDTYHHTPHKGLNGLTPFQKYQQALDEGFIPRKPAKPKDEFWVDFSDHIPRSVRREGIEYERVFYWSPDIQAWYDQGVKSVIVIPSRTDISKIQVIGPDKKLYEVFSKDHRLPNLTRSEYRQYRKKIAIESRMGSLSNAEIARRVSAEHEMVQNAKRLTKRTRKANEQRRLNKMKAEKKSFNEIPSGEEFNVSKFLRDNE